jgi:DNA-directed RNA polymerase beta subunit
MASNYVEEVAESVKNITTGEQMLGKGLMMPNNATNSGARKIMFSSQTEAALVLSRGDVPYVATGYENRFGDYSSSILATDEKNNLNSDYEVLAKVSKFSYAPNHHYWLILRDLNSNKLDIIERISYKFRTEVYGYLHNNSMMDTYAYPGAIIPKGTVLRRSTGFDQYGNKTNGANINVAYMALDHNMEDSVIISDTCSEKLSAPLIRTVKIILNENDIPLNIYGDDSIYKVHPDIGEDVKDGILMAYRREKREEAIYTQSVQRLQKIMMSDDKITVKGKVIDIEIRCNNIEHISKSAYNQQFLSYYNDRIRAAQEIVNTVGPYISQGYTMSYNLEKKFELAKAEINGNKFIDKKLFSNISIEFTIMENRPLGVGDKVSDRYGGKGVISKIVPVDLMPKMANGLPIEMIKNSSTMYNRENAGQIFELEINYISMCILDHIRNPGDGTRYDPETAIRDILDFIKIQSPKEYESMSAYVNTLSLDELAYFVESILSKTCIPISNNPMSETMDIDKLGKLYEAFPWIRQRYIKVPIVDSNGNYRFVNSRRPMIVAPIYCLRLKQFAEEKFSATSLSSTNLKNENTKSKASKNYREPNSNTPIKFGQMESGDFDHMGTEYVVANLMLHSLSPHGRRLVEQIATGDPYNVNVHLDSKATNRSAEILATRLKTMGYRLKFTKKKKEIKFTFLTPALEFFEGSDECPIEAVEFHEEGYDYRHYYKTIEEIEEIKKKSPIMINALSFTESLDVVGDPVIEDVAKKLYK